MKNEIDVLRIFLNWYEIWRKLMCHRNTSNPGVLKLGFVDKVQGVHLCPIKMLVHLFFVEKKIEQK